jgi:hypothetical protein
MMSLGVHYRFFDVMVDPESGRYFSEGYGFCRLWEKIGGEICIDAKFRSYSRGTARLARRFRGDNSQRLPCGGRRSKRAAYPGDRDGEFEAERLMLADFVIYGRAPRSASRRESHCFFAGGVLGLAGGACAWGCAGAASGVAMEMP